METILYVGGDGSWLPAGVVLVAQPRGVGFMVLCDSKGA